MGYRWIVNQDLPPVLIWILALFLAGGAIQKNKAANFVSNASLIVDALI